MVTSDPTDAAGAFRVEAPSGPWKGLLLRASRGPLSVSADLGESTGPGPVVMTLRLPASFTVGGIVLSAEDGRPLDDIRVRFGERETTTARGGRFTFQDLPAALLEEDLPAVSLSGEGRRSLERTLPASGGLDDLLLRMDPQ